LKKNILFISIDSLRSDFVYDSNKESLTPNIDKIIKNGLFFSQTFSSSDATLFSWSSMFTGLFPFKTGIDTSSNFNKINHDITTLFDILSKEDYSFYGFRPNLSETIGIFPKFKNPNHLYDIHESLDGNLGTNILQLLSSELNKEPWFYFIHLNDLHFPLRVPDHFNDSKYGKSKYERALFNIDFWIGKIIEKIDLEKTLLIITADHGSYIKFLEHNNEKFDFEEIASKELVKNTITKKIPKFLKPVKDNFFYKSEMKKNHERQKYLENSTLTISQIRELSEGKFSVDHTLFDSKLKIPLLFLSNSIKPSIVNHLTRSVDILPTICDLLEIKINNKIDGVSLLPRILENSDNLIAYIQSTPLIDIKSNDVIGIRTSDYKYFRDKFEPKKRVHLYNIQTDPNEETNLANIDLKTVNQMEKILVSIMNQSSKKNNTMQNDDSNLIEDELKKMGYV
jgi:arylsulfatase A-like enzyme